MNFKCTCSYLVVYCFFVQVASSELLEDLKVIATAGPTHDDQPVFKWSTSGFKPLPQGQPDVFDFEPVIIQWKL